MLTLENLSYSRGDKLLFNNLGLTISDGSILLIRGANGSGKTTLLEIIAGLKKATTGKILYANKDVSEHYAEYCDMIEYIGHKLAIKNNLTVFDNLSFWASIKGSKEAVDIALEFFGFGEYKNTVAAKLSAGFKKRLSLARLMVSNADIWLLDEPFANLDNEGQNSLAALIGSKCANGGLVIVTAHGDVPLANFVELNFCDF